MFNFCFHSWSEWSNVQVVGTSLFQFRFCRKCRLAQKRTA